MKNVPDLVHLNLKKNENWSHQVLLMMELRLKRSLVIWIMELIKIGFIPVAKNVTLQLFHIFRIIYHLTTKSSSILNTYILKKQIAVHLQFTFKSSERVWFQSPKNIWVTIGFHKWFHCRCCETRMENEPAWTYNRVNVHGRK